MISIFIPLLLQVGLTLILMPMVARLRTKEIKATPGLFKKAALDNKVYSDNALKIANNYDNQFQLPVLFYVACLLALMSGTTGVLAGIFAWGFVLSRIGHTIIHTTTNNLLRRFQTFALGLTLLIGFWTVVAIGVINSPLLTKVSP
ncbi:MAG: MAPEG family protein [Pseudomonadota bacterium]